MKFISYLVLVVCALVLAATLDAVPDPPAVAPHAVSAKASCLSEFVGAFREQRLTSDSAWTLPYAPLHGGSLADAARPKRSGDWIALAAYAGDPSPPVI